MIYMIMEEKTKNVFGNYSIPTSELRALFRVFLSNHIFYKVCQLITTRIFLSTTSINYNHEYDRFMTNPTC